MSSEIPESSNDAKQRRLQAELEVALSAHSGDRRPWWEYVTLAAGAAAGIGLMVVVLGAIAMELRLAKAGLPTASGLDAQSPSSLAGVGARDVLVWMLLNAGIAIAMHYVIDAQYRTIVNARARGASPPFQRP